MNTTFFPSPEELLEQGVNAAKKQVQITVKQTAGQVTGQQSVPTDNAGVQALNDQMNQDFVRDMYQPTDLSKPHMQGNQQTSQASGNALSGAGNVADEKALAEKRKELELLTKQHKESYYIPTFEKPKQEERAAEKVEREENEEKQKRWELQEKKEKEQPISVTMSTNKAEQFRGAAG